MAIEGRNDSGTTLALGLLLTVAMALKSCSLKILKRSAPKLDSQAKIVLPGSRAEADGLFPELEITTLVENRGILV